MPSLKKELKQHRQADPCLVLSTAGSSEEASKLAKEILEKKLAACVNIIPSISSIYWWQGKIETSPESLLLIKTLQSQLKPLSDFLKLHHPYEVPELVALPIFWGNQVYLDWLKKSIKSP
ncbi:MAG: divalent-cation tolerance protein CutA [Candidatus Omnitrophica bacterium]|nr:divalent-cation tolerance protein CutA [Candidatus Omnitrophota bacterium]